MYGFSGSGRVDYENRGSDGPIQELLDLARWSFADDRIPAALQRSH